MCCAGAVLMLARRYQATTQMQTSQLTPMLCSLRLSGPAARTLPIPASDAQGLADVRTEPQWGKSRPSLLLAGIALGSGAPPMWPEGP